MKKICFNRSVKSLLLVLLTSSLGASLCFAQMPGGDDEGSGPWKKMSHDKRKDITEELNLTQEQKDKLGQLRKIDQAERTNLFNALKSAKTRLRQELDKPQSDPNELKKLSAEINTLQANMTDLHIKSVLDMKQVLTAEQFQELQKKAKERLEKRNKHKKMCEKNDAQKSKE